MNDRVYISRRGELIYCEYFRNFNVFLFGGCLYRRPVDLDTIAKELGWERIE